MPIPTDPRPLLQSSWGLLQGGIGQGAPTRGAPSEVVLCHSSGLLSHSESLSDSVRGTILCLSTVSSRCVSRCRGFFIQNRVRRSHSVAPGAAGQEGQPEDSDLRAGWAWWKAKKWVLHITHRLFHRYGDPKHCRDRPADAAFAALFLDQCSLKFLEAHMALVGRYAEVPPPPLPPIPPSPLPTPVHICSPSEHAAARPCSYT